MSFWLRFSFMFPLVVLVGQASAQTPEPKRSAAPDPLTTHEPNLYLFVDDHWIATQKGVRRVVNRPKLLKEPVVWPEDPKTEADCAWGNVIREPNGKFRMWYCTSMMGHNGRGPHEMAKAGVWGRGDDNSPGGGAVPSSPVKAENAAAGESKTEAAGIDDLSDAELAGLLQDPTDEPTTVPPAQAAVEQKTVEGRGPLTFNGHTGCVVSVSFSPDGKRIVSSSYDNTLKIWDAHTGQETFTLKGHKREVVSVNFSPDGKRIVSGCVDNTLKVWDISSLDMSK